MHSYPDPRMQEKSRNRQEPNRESVQSEVDTAQKLQQIATQLIDVNGIGALYEQILDTVLAILNPDFASLQMFYPERASGGELRLLSHRGFSAEAAKRWEWVRSTTRTTCGEALRTRQRVTVTDIRKCDFMAGSEGLDGYLEAGIHAGQTTPLVSRSGDLLGMISTYWRDPHELTLSEMRAFDVLSRLAADLLERSQKEQALKRSEERFSRVMNNVAEGLYTTDQKGLVTFLNPAAERILGWSSAEVLGKKMHDLIHFKHPDGSPFPASECARLQVLRTGIELRQNADYFIRKDGSLLPVVTSSSPIKDGDEIIGMVVVFSDDTERRRAETALRESEERFRRVADTAPVIIWVCGADKLCTFVNKGWLDFTGRTMEEELGYGWTERIHTEDFEASVAAFTSSYDTRRRYQIEFRARRADGAYRWMLDCGDPLFGRGGEFQGYIGSCVDITDLKLAQDAVLSRQKLESVGLLAAGIAHDFGNLMAGVIASADIALLEVADGSEAAEQVQNIQTIAFRASEIVRELLVYSGRETAGPETLHVSRLIDEMSELLKISIPKRVTLTVSCEENLPSIIASAAQIRQVVMNLIINAADAIGEDSGTIAVTASCVTGGKELAPGSATELSAGDYVRLDVADTGCGMSEQQRKRVFDPFFTTKPTGRGLGLAVVQGIVYGHNGAISVLSVPGEGTTFQVFLPVAVGAAANA